MPAKPAPTRRDAKRAKIVAVAKTLFFREGYVGASMAEIAAQVGGSKATLYTHFRSKEELLIAVVQDVMAPVIEEVDAGPPPDDFRAWLSWLGRLSFRKLTSYDLLSLQRLAQGEALRFPEIGQIFYEQGVVPSLAAISGPFLQAMDTGVLRRSDPRQAAELFIELCTGWHLRRVLWNIAPAPSDAEIERNVETAIDVFMAGYATRSDAAVVR